MLDQRKILGFFVIGIGLFAVYIISISFKDFKLGDYITQVAVAITAFVIGIGYWTFKPEIDRHFKKDTDSGKNHLEESTINQVNEKYVEHVRKFFSMINERAKNKYTLDYIESIRDIQDEKKMILQHFSTIELLHEKYSSLYVWYRTIVGLQNDIQEDRKKVQSTIIHMDTEIRNLGFAYPPSDNWIQIQDLESAMGIKSLSLMEMVRTKLMDTEYHIFTNVKFEFPLTFDESKKEWNLGTTNNKFAGSKSKETIEKLSELIHEYGLEIMTQSHDIASMENSIDRILKAGFNQKFNELYQTVIHGEPKVGVCNACLEWFTPNEKKEMKRILDNFNANYEMWNESLWTNKKDKF
ncbi:MAG: hypothetical protein QW177_06420 [Candidatus Nitrosotenuis sp.]